VKRHRSSHQPDTAGSAFDAALEDLNPLHVANIMAAALTAASGSSGSNGSNGSTLYLPSMVSSGLSSSRAMNGGQGSFGSSSGSEGMACPPVPITLRLVCISGWGECDPRFAPPLAQRRVARWLRHKLAEPRPPAVSVLTGLGALPAAAAAAGQGRLLPHQQQRQQQQPEVQVVPLDGQQQPQHQQQQQQRSWAGVVRGARPGRGFTQQQEGPEPQQQQQQQRMVLQVSAGVDVLVSRVAAIPGPQGSEVKVEVVDIAPSTLDHTLSNSGSNGSNGGWGAGSSVPGVLQGVCGVLLLVSGPDAGAGGAGRGELQGAVKRLGLLLQHTPAGVAVPVTVLACSGELLCGSVHGAVIRLDRVCDALSRALSACRQGGVTSKGVSRRPPAQE